MGCWHKSPFTLFWTMVVGTSGIDRLFPGLRYFSKAPCSGVRLCGARHPASLLCHLMTLGAGRPTAFYSWLLIYKTFPRPAP